MSQIRPKLLVSYGRENAPLQVPLVDQIVQSPVCTLASDTAAGTTSLTVTSVTPFVDIEFGANGFFAILGVPGQPNAEIVDITGNNGVETFTLSEATLYPHSASSPITFLPYEGVLLWHADTVTGAKTTVNSSVEVNPSLPATSYTDTAFTDGYYFAQFVTNAGAGGIGNDAATLGVVTISTAGTNYVVGNVLTADGGGDVFATITVTSIDGSGGVTGFTVLTPGSGYPPNDYSLSGGAGTGAILTIAGFLSPYSDPVPYASYTLYSARSIIDTALGEINKKTSEVLSDEYAFQQLDMFQTDVLKEMKRWSFMQKFDYVMGQFNVGEWKIPMPDDIEDPNTNQSVYNVRVGTNGRLTWIDKAKWSDFVFNLAYSTLALPLSTNDTTITLVDSGDFNHLTESNTDGSGTVIIGPNSYNYSANDTSTGVLTLTEPAASAADAGTDVFQNANQGLPTYYTIFDNYLYYWPITSNEYDGNNAFLDYYTKQQRIRKDSDEIVVPDPQAASYFLQWKFLKKLNNGQEDNSTLIQKQNYIERRDKLKSKKVLNRMFKLHPRFQNFAQMEQYDSGDPRYIRDGNFPNTGF